MLTFYLDQILCPFNGDVPKQRCPKGGIPPFKYVKTFTLAVRLNFREAGPIQLH